VVPQHKVVPKRPVKKRVNISLFHFLPVLELFSLKYRVFTVLFMELRYVFSEKEVNGDLFNV
jgi:hypothetical protein